MTPEVGLDRQMFWDSKPLLTSFNTIKVSSSVKHIINAMGEDEPPLTITWAILMNLKLSAWAVVTLLGSRHNS